MYPRKTMIAATAISVLFVAGCATPYRKQVRNEAYDRFNQIQAQMSYDQAQQAFETGQFDKSMRLVETAITRYPDGSNYHLLQGRIHLERHRLELAMKAFDKSVELDETNHKAHYFRGIVLQRWSQFEDALAAYKSAYDNQEENVQYLLAAAEMHIALGRFDEAEQMITPRMDYFEHNAALHQMLGQIALLKNESERAVDHFKQARLLNPEDTMVVEDLARAQFEAGQYGQAYQSLQTLRSLGVEDRADLRHLEARCLSLSGEMVEARALYMQLSQEMPSNVDIWVELGNVAYEVGDFRRVALAASRIISLEPKRYEGPMLKGMYEQHRGNLDYAIQQYVLATELNDDAAWPWLLLGLAYEEKGSFGKAAACYQTVLNNDPTNQHAQKLYGLVSDASSN